MLNRRYGEKRLALRTKADPQRDQISQSYEHDRDQGLAIWQENVSSHHRQKGESCGFAPRVVFHINRSFKSGQQRFYR